MKQLFLKKVKNIIHKHIEEKKEIDVSSMSKQLNLDRTQVYRKLKKATGKSPSHFIKETKLEYGEQLLAIEDATINNIAHSSGFSDSNYFIRCFKKKHGTTPEKYRKQKNKDTT